ncbi:MAG: hypothetical protein IKK30_06190 [Clostridia bacterium]|nr:hypothetical protein [Clostridia bacterium]
MNEKLRELIIKYKRYWYAPVLVVTGIALMLIRPDRNQTVETAAIGISDRNFVSETEARLEEMLKGINGAGDCEVTITLASGGKKEYVREEGRVLVITDKDGNQSAVISKENAPEIAGVTVISSSRMNINIKNNIIHSIGTVLGVGTNKICVVFLNGG